MKQEQQLLADLKKVILEYAEDRAEKITQKIIEAKIDPLQVMNQTIAEEIRADGYGKDAVEAVVMAKRLTGLPPTEPEAMEGVSG
jgi:methanogenic corrinoid protein MtbC1